MKFVLKFERFTSACYPYNFFFFYIYITLHLLGLNSIYQSDSHFIQAVKIIVIAGNRRQILL